LWIPFPDLLPMPASNAALGQMSKAHRGDGSARAPSLRAPRVVPRIRARLRVELLEDRLNPVAVWQGYAQGPQHTALSAVASQPLNAIRWQTPVDLQPQYSGTSLLIHYGSPAVSAANTVIVPVKTGATGGFEVNAFDGGTGALRWSRSTAYQLPPSPGWTPSYGPVLTSAGRYYFPGPGGTLNVIDDPDGAGTVSGPVAFFGLANYNSNPTAYNGTVFINTPLTADAAGNIYFGFRVTGANPLNLTNGLARLAPDGTGTWTSAQTMLGETGAGDRVVYNCAPAVSNNGQTVYVAVNRGTSGFTSTGALVALDSTTLAVQRRVALADPKSGSAAWLPDLGTASPTVGPDGDVYFGVLENPFPQNHDRGWLLHFSGDLTTAKIPGAFGWDDTASVVPASMVPSYQGPSAYLLMTKYNNYAGRGGDGVNRIAILDPNVTQTDPVTGQAVMQEVLTIAGITPDEEFIDTHPNAVREWCINTAVVDPATHSVLANCEDGRLYRWDLTTNTFTQSITLTSGIGEAYTPTLIGADGAVYAINNAILFAVGDFQPSTTGLHGSPNPSTISNPVTFTSTVTGPAWTATGIVEFFDGTTSLGSDTLDNNGMASITVATLSAGTHHITARYGGDEHFAPSDSSVDQQVNRVSTGTTLTSSGNPTTYGQTVVLTATVSWTPLNNLPAPTGVVYFYDEATLLGAGVLSGNQTVLNVNNLSVGSHDLTAQYAGDANYEVSLSPVVVQEVDGLPTLGGVPILAQVNEGQTLAFTATVENPGMPSFSLVGAPAGAAINPTTGAFSWTPAEDQGPGTFAFIVRLTDGATTDDRPITVQVIEVNTAPVLTGVPAAMTTAPGSVIAFTAVATDADRINGLPNTLNFSLVGAPANAWIDPDTGEFRWTPDETNPLGTYMFKVRVADDGVPSLHDTKSIVITLTAAGLVDNAGVVDLLVGGTGAADTIGVVRSLDRTRLIVRRNGAVIGSFPAADVSGRIVVHGLGGNDRVTVAAAIAKPAELYGDAGNDTLTGGAGNDRLFGGPGNDRLAAGKGNDILVGGDGNDTLSDAVGVNLLIGGVGTDRLTGGTGEELLIGGPTAYDLDPTGLTAILAEWTSGSPYADRVAHLTGTTGGLNNGTFLTPGVTVTDDGWRDVLTGGKGSDWFVVGIGDALDRKDPEQALTV
jgi:Bacterial Ig-like domain (group 3)/RTX calcium-binding nonapeptide repeat (4 copies)